MHAQWFLRWSSRRYATFRKYLDLYVYTFYHFSVTRTIGCTSNHYDEWHAHNRSNSAVAAKLVEAYRVPRHISIIMSLVDAPMSETCRGWSFADKVHPSVLRALSNIEYVSIEPLEPPVKCDKCSLNILFNNCICC
jgi:capsid portal protein